MALSHAILTALLEDDMSGFELARSFDSSLGLFWQATHQQIYQELAKLADKDYLNAAKVAQTGKRSKIVYHLKPAGRRALQQWIFEQSKFREAKDDLLIKLHNLDEENASHLITEIEQRREQVMGRLYLYERIRRAHYGNLDALSVRRRGVYLALAAAVTRDEAFLRWCDEALAMLSNITGA